VVFQVALTCFSRVCTDWFDDKYWDCDLPGPCVFDMHPFVKLRYVVEHGSTEAYNFKPGVVVNTPPLVKLFDNDHAYGCSITVVAYMCYSADVKRFVMMYSDLDLQHFFSIDPGVITKESDDYDRVVLARDFCKYVSKFGFKSVAPYTLLNIVEGLIIYTTWKKYDCVKGLRRLENIALRALYLDKVVPMIGQHPLRALSFVLKDYDSVVAMVRDLDKYSLVNWKGLSYEDDGGFDVYINNLFDEVMSLPEFHAKYYDRDRILVHFTGFFFEHIWMIVPFFFRILTFRLGL